MACSLLYPNFAMIVPVRAGGGTRIKVLEAFAHQCPVVSTEFGVEGIAGHHEEHFYPLCLTRILRKTVYEYKTTRSLPAGWRSVPLIW
jgi:hypothetical protein